MTTPVLLADYTTADKVVRFLKLADGTFGPATTITSQAIIEAIDRAESYLDSQTYTSWKMRLVTAELHDLARMGFSVKHRPIVDVTQLRIYELGAVARVLEEGRDKDFIVDKASGIVRWNWRLQYGFSPAFARYGQRVSYDAVEIDYRWGRQVEEDGDEIGLLESVTNKLVGIELLDTSFYHKLFPRSTDHIDFRSTRDQWQKDVDDFVERFRYLTGGM